MSGRVVYREEICGECGYDFERQWVTDLVPARSPVPAGWKVDKRQGAWKHISRPTRWGTVCMCGTA